MVESKNPADVGVDTAATAAQHSTTTSYAKKALLAANFFIETNRMEPFVAVYYITFQGWNEVNIGVISLVMNLIMIFFQTPAGDLLDKIHYKKTVTILSILVASITTASPAWTNTFWIVLVLKSLEGIAATIFLPALMSLLLGICLTESEVPTYIAQCEISNKIGSVLFTLGCGLISYFLYPEITSMFYLLGGGGILASFAIAAIPSSAIDFNRARKATVTNTELVVEEDDLTTEEQLMTHKENTSNDDNDVSNPNDNSKQSNKREHMTRAVFQRSSLSLRHSFKSSEKDNTERSSKKEWMMRTSSQPSSLSLAYSYQSIEKIEEHNLNNQMESGIGAIEDITDNYSDNNDDEQNNNHKATTEVNNDVVSYRTLLKDKNILAFSIVTFIYHLANAAVVPLVSQYIAIGDERASMVFVSACLLIFYFAQGFTSYGMITFVKKFSPKTLLVVAHLVLPVRCALIVIIIFFGNGNRYALAATQFLDGIGAGIYDTMIPIVVGMMTEGTGRFGFTYGFIITTWRVGHGVSLLMGESIVHASGYTTAFFVHAGIAFISVMILVSFVHFKKKSNNNSIVGNQG